MTEPDEIKTRSPAAMSHPALLQHNNMAQSVTDLNHKVTQQKLTMNTALRSRSDSEFMVTEKTLAGKGKQRGGVLHIWPIGKEDEMNLSGLVIKP